MAHKKAAIKYIKVSKRNRTRRLTYINKIKELAKNAKKAISAKTDEAVKLVQDTIRALDKAVSAGVIHRNTAARKKSRLMKKLK